MIRDFVKMRQDLEKKGFFEPDYFWLTVRFFYILSLWLLGYYVVSFNYFWGLFILSWALQQSGWVHHEGGHRSLTGNVRVDGAIQQFCVGILFSASANFWNYQHNHHHANTQHEEHDIDLKTLPLIAFDRAVLESDDEGSKEKPAKEKSVKTPKSKKKNISFWVKHQWLTFLLSNLVIYSLWRFFIHNRYELRKRRYYHFLISFGVCFIWHYGFLMKFSQLDFLWATITYMAYSSLGVWLLLLHFTVSHTFTGVHDGKYNWIETAAHYTVNVSDHWLVNLVMGLLNFQIEHHLFPQMSHQNARRAAPYIRELFKKYQLPYYVYGYCHGFSLVIQNLYHVGHDLPDVRPTVTNLTTKTKSS
jgi:fatty acid desaturase